MICERLLVETFDAGSLRLTCNGCTAIRVTALKIFCDQLEVPERSLTFRAGRRERPFEAVAHVIVNQCLFGAFNGALHCLQLLRDLSARPALFDHFNDFFEVTVGAFQTSGNRGMWLVHEILLTSWEDNSHPPGRIQKIA